MLFDHRMQDRGWLLRYTELGTAHVDDFLRGEAGFAAREHRHEEKDRDQPDMLKAAQDQDACAGLAYPGIGKAAAGGAVPLTTNFRTVEPIP